ncbi:thiol:disulfide interchange protein DsbA/DsbL [Pseudoalteromonas sp. DL2-H2.2]|uniref:Thiol:disulfide interchange protein n=1 Tax=Pseudoalteromonas rubra TaxID=43658 RepID=A0A0F4QDC6_9GAMM|nr:MULTISPECIES: thiol:disulfide interchange protein DsbA/DsbL [Pseudoalteromonas]KJZ05708.1 disulfide bond formation protein [Pseudoalteromonas rubra]MCF2911101.1 thiol:disulfide interchange protein DsbA/DsbL [Pseudoalteromonas sp. DL2-H2.2]
MLKSIKVALIALCMPVLAMAADFTDGKHYQTLTTAKSDSAKVTEFFSYYCPHCFQFEPVAKALEKNLPAGAVFEKSHVNFLGGLSPQVQSYLSYAYIIAKHHGKAQQVSDQIFNTIHVQQVQLKDLKDIKKLLEANGISGEQFDAAMASMPVISAEKAMVEKQDTFSKAGALTGVPTFIVNDKYKINLRELSSQAELDELVKHLLEK